MPEPAYRIHATSPAVLSPQLSRRHAPDPEASAVPEAVQEVLDTPGLPLDETARTNMGRAFGHDFSQVRVHTDPRAAASAHAVQAHAYTVGRHMVFGAGQYAPATEAGRRLLAHELTHVAEQRNTGGRPVLRRQSDQEAVRARLQVVRARLAELRTRQRQSTETFGDSLARERQRQSLARSAARDQAQSRSSGAARQLLGGTFAGARIRQIVRVSATGNAVTLTVPFQLTYLALPDQEAQQRATSDAPRIEAAISNAWQVNISSGEYAGVTFRMLPTVTYLQRGTPRRNDAFLIEVRGPDNDPSQGDSVRGLISLAPVHLAGTRVIVVAHELAHLFGFMDTYFTMTTHVPHGRDIVRSNVARSDPSNRPDLLGMIDPTHLQRMEAAGEITAQEAARQRGNVTVWEEEASIVLRTLGVRPPAPQPPGPDSEDFDPQVDLERIQREGQARLAPIRERRSRAQDSLRWLDTVEEIMRLEREEQDLARRLGSGSAH